MTSRQGRDIFWHVSNGINIIVCLKQVPAPESFSWLTLDSENFTLAREPAPVVTNPDDRHALEEALRLREKLCGKITVLTMGPPRAVEVIEEALAVGADEGVLLCDRALAGADTLATAYALACAIRKLGEYDLIVCGHESLDSGTGHVGPQLAEMLGVPHVTGVISLEASDRGTILATSKIEHGRIRWNLQLPGLIAVRREINSYRLPTAMGIMEAGGKTIRTWNAADIGADSRLIGLAGSPTRVIGMAKHESKRKRELIQGPPVEAASKAIRRLRELHLI